MTGLPFLIRTGRDCCRCVLDLSELLSHPPLSDLGGSLEDTLLIAQVEVSWGFHVGRGREELIYAVVSRRRAIPAIRTEPIVRLGQ